MDPICHVSFIILDEQESLEEITTCTGIQPSRIWQKGELKPKTNMVFKENGWELKSTLAGEAPILDHIKALLATLEPNWSELRKFTNKYYSEFACAIYFEETFPEIHLDSNVVKQLAELNVSLDIDLYELE